MNLQTISIDFDEELLPVKELSTGKLHCFYERGAIRYLKYEETEMIRMIYFAVRDSNWQTPESQIENEVIDVQENGFTIFYTSYHRLNNLEYRSDVSIEAKDNVLSFQVSGEALSEFERNRIGICLLHPLNNFKGRSVSIQRPDGSAFESTFPDRISPHQPFKDIQQLKFEVNGINASLEFEGEVFETEDQRNWSDSSFKTYSTPLALPFPVGVQAGDQIEQRVKLVFKGSAAFRQTKAYSDVTTSSPFPKIGYSSQPGYYLTPADLKVLAQLPFHHYRVTVNVFDDHWKDEFSRKLDETKRLNTKMELVLLFKPDWERKLDEVVQFINKDASAIVRFLPVSVASPVTPTSLLNKLYPAIKHFAPSIEVGYGTNGYFADLNRNPPIKTEFDFVSFGLTPQVHATDTRTIIENLHCQRDLIDTIHGFAAGKKICVGPVSFKMSNNASSKTGMPADYDQRLHKNLGAIWTLATIRNMSGASSITLYQTTGHKGLIYGSGGEPQPSRLIEILTAIKSFDPKRIIEKRIDSGLPSEIVLENETGQQMKILINLTGREILKVDY